MGNIYGVANPTPLPAIFSPASDTTITAGTATTFTTSGPLSVPYPGDFYPEVLGVVAVLMGATPPSALTITFILGAGSAVDTYTVPPALLTANATLMVPLILIGANSGSQWQGSGATINVQATATGQNVTVKQVGTRLQIYLSRGPDA